MPVYIEKINGDVDRPTNQPTDQQGEYRAICLFALVLIGIELYSVYKGLLCLYILKKLMVTSTNRPTNQPTGRI